MNTNNVLFDDNIIELRDSKEFMKNIVDCIPSAIFLLDNNFEIQAFNKSLETVFSYVSNNEIIYKLVGDVIGCAHSVEEGKQCGGTSKCPGCILRNTTIGSFTSMEPIYKQKLTRDFYTNDSVKTRKHLEFSTRFIEHENKGMVIVILNDISEISEQKLKIEKQKEQIDASIRYAENIQNAVLPLIKNLESERYDNFILNIPKDVIGGDFYWFKQTPDKLFLTVGDCTGHGIPGALISILGISIINSLENNIFTLSTDEFLLLLRNKLIKYLHSSEGECLMKDGMDIAYSIINFETKKLQFSGANNSLFLVRNKEIIVLPGNKIPIGHCYKGNNLFFDNHEIEIMPNDTIYLFSDGYIDQFGGLNNKKIGTNHFKDILIEISDKPIPEQKEILHTTFLEWKGYNTQTDDICIVGIKIK
ncbi:MAG: hypothetical protein A2X08_06515 [Bacteroidetes bacterium GWA2_32_17]|nr:MAG: hypothetical protein A2X08_06515 [Bacteroidetes bacterium GWA2_32_17]